MRAEHCSQCKACELAGVTRAWQAGTEPYGETLGTRRYARSSVLRLSIARRTLSKVLISADIIVCIKLTLVTNRFCGLNFVRKIMHASVCGILIVLLGIFIAVLAYDLLQNNAGWLKSSQLPAACDACVAWRAQSC